MPWHARVCLTRPKQQLSAIATWLLPMAATCHCPSQFWVQLDSCTFYVKFAVMSHCFWKTESICDLGLLSGKNHRIQLMFYSNNKKQNSNTTLPIFIFNGQQQHLLAVYLWFSKCTGWECAAVWSRPLGHPGTLSPSGLTLSSWWNGLRTSNSSKPPSLAALKEARMQAFVVEQNICLPM